MELTKQQRHEIYKDALDMHKNLGKDEKIYLCVLIRNRFTTAYAVLIDVIELNYMFPELFLFKPELYMSTFDSWWAEFDYSSEEVKEHQRTILEFCIEMTK